MDAFLVKSGDIDGVQPGDDNSGAGDSICVDAPHVAVGYGAMEALMYRSYIYQSPVDGAEAALQSARDTLDGEESAFLGCFDMPRSGAPARRRRQTSG